MITSICFACLPFFRITFSLLVKHNGDLTFENIIKIARVMRPRSMAKKLEGTVKEIRGKYSLVSSSIIWSLRFTILNFTCIFLGTAQSVGCTINGQHPHDIIDQINSGELEVPEE